MNEEAEGIVKVEEVDWYRDTWARYLGYANEVGEACRGLVPPGLVTASYGLVAIYVLADTYDKGRKTYHQTFSSGRERLFAVGDKVADTFVWQTLASLLVPPLFINRTCKASAWAMEKFFPLARYPAFTASKRAVLTTSIGLATIPVIVHPIDHAVHVAMDHTTRPLSSYMRGQFLSTSRSAPPLSSSSEPASSSS